MSFFAFGINHETASVSLRERFALRPEHKTALLADFQHAGKGELVLLSTCNRTEAYLFGPPADVAVVQDLLAGFAGIPYPHADAFYHEDEAAVRHVLTVATGLCSQVLGDAQIFAQLKEGYRIAVEAGRVETVMHRWMHTAFRAARRVANETALAQGIGSVAHLAVAAAQVHMEERGSSLECAQVLVLGAGEMAEAALRKLSEERVAQVRLANRTLAHAEPLAERYRATMASWETRAVEAALADVVIVATGAPEPVLTADALHAVGPTLVIDISMPRNADPALRGQPGCTLLDLDALKQLRNTLDQKRIGAVPAAQRICTTELSEFVAWAFHQEALQPAIHVLQQTFDHIRQQEIERHHHRFSDADRDDLDKLTRSIMQKLLAIPVVHLKASSEDTPSLREGVRLLNQLFALPGCVMEPPREAPPSVSADVAPVTSAEASP